MFSTSKRRASAATRNSATASGSAKKRSRRPGRGSAGGSLSGSIGVLAGSHREAFGNALRRLLKQPFATVMTLLVIGIALALPAGLHLLVQNARLISGEWASAIDLSVYATPGTSSEALDALRQSVERLDEVDGVIVITAAQAIEDFKALSGFGRAIESFDENPLPASLIVRPNGIDDDPEKMSALAATLGALPNVDLVQLDTEWVARFQGILEVVRRAVMVAAFLLALAVLVIVGNTIRVEVQQRHDEIEITKLVGGTDAFIRRPFVYTGFWYGLMGGALAVGLVTLAVELMAGPVQRVAGLYGSDFTLRGLGDWQWSWLLLASILLGVLGAFIASSRQIRKIEPG
ncbi:MAG: permease-like cell division protein FtsX [Gammaproteobacteria bacterium]